MTEREKLAEEIKYRLSDLGVQIGNIAIEYITELEEQISFLLSCKNCPNNKGGLLCQRDKYRNMVFDKDEQLAKAKKLIEDICYVYHLKKNELATARIIAEAEEFLKNKPNEEDRDG